MIAFHCFDLYRKNSATHLASMARYEAAFGNELNHVWDQSLRKEAKEYATSFRSEAPQTGINTHLSGVWRTTPMTTFEDKWIRYGLNYLEPQGVDSVNVPEPIAAIFKEVLGEEYIIGENGGSKPNELFGLSARVLLTPTQKFSFDPPQLHTMPDLPAEEWYNFDWIGVIDSGMFGGNKKLEELKERLKEILPESPSPKNTTEAFFWEEMKKTGLTPQEYYGLALTWEHSKQEAIFYKSLGVDYHKALAEDDYDLLAKVNQENPEAFHRLTQHFQSLRELGRGVHWHSQEIDPRKVTPSYHNAVTAIKEDPDYEKAFDESIPYEEREAIRMALDKRMREMIDTGWQQFLLDLQQSILKKEPLRAALAAV